MVERYVPEVESATFAAAVRRASVAAEAMTEQGRPVRYLGSVYVPDEECSFCCFEAEDADAVREAEPARGPAGLAGRRRGGDRAMTSSARRWRCSRGWTAAATALAALAAVAGSAQAALDGGTGIRSGDGSCELLPIATNRRRSPARPSARRSPTSSTATCPAIRAGSRGRAAPAKSSSRRAWRCRGSARRMSIRTSLQIAPCRSATGCGRGRTQPRERSCV